MTICRYNAVRVWFSQFSVCRFFVIAACILQVTYLFTFFNNTHYSHGQARFLHVMHLAYTVLGDSDTLPVSFLELTKQQEPRFMDNALGRRCNLENPVERPYCMTERRAYLSCPVISSFTQLMHIPLDPDKRFPFTSHKDAADFPFIGYSLYIAGALVGIILHLPPILIMYCSIVANCATVIWLGYATLRILPTFRWPICFLLLTPSLCLSRNFILPDAMAADITFFIIALVLYLKTNPVILTPLQKFGLLILGLAIGFIKIMYGSVALLFYIIPAPCFGGQRPKNIYVTLVAATSIIGGVYFGNHVMVKLFNGNPTFGEQYDYRDQVHYILNNFPQYVIEMFGTFYRDQVKYYQHLFAIFTATDLVIVWRTDRFNIPQITLPRSLPFILVTALMLLSALYKENGSKAPSFSIIERVRLFTIFMVCIGSVYTARFIFTAHPMAWNLKYGFSIGGRYLITLFPIFLLIFHRLIKIPDRLYNPIKVILITVLIGFLTYLHYFQLIYKKW